MGLGNPGTRYENTRHNLGFLVLQKVLTPAFGLKFQETMQGLAASAPIGEDVVHFFMPQTYMNLSAVAVAPYLENIEIPSSHLLVIHDDLDIPFDQIKFQSKGSSGGHQGVQSLLSSETLSSGDFDRLRIGIGRPAPGQAVADYVLEVFSSEEQKRLPRILERAGEVVKSWLTGGSKQVRDTLSRQD